MSDEYRVLYAPAAVEDLRDIYSYLAHNLLVPDTAARQVGRIRQDIRSLDLMPLRFPRVDWEPWNSLGMRRMTVDHYVVFYTVEPQSGTVTVIRIVYGSRDLPALADET